MASFSFSNMSTDQFKKYLVEDQHLSEDVVDVTFEEVLGVPTGWSDDEESIRSQLTRAKKVVEDYKNSRVIVK